MNIKYIILFTLVLFIQLNRIYGQGLCEPNGITTNPDAPVNDLNKSMENTFFDWRLDDFHQYFDPYYLSTLHPAFESISPFWSGESYASYLSGKYTGEETIDYAVNEGWELLARGLGRTKNDAINPEFYSPYILLYNKYKGRMRMLFGIPPGGAHGQIDDIEVQVSFNSAIPNGMLAYHNKIAQPLDQQTDVLRLHAENNFIEDGWCHVEIPIAFDPCVCKHPTSLKIEVFKVSEATATMTGLIYGLNTPIDIYGADDYYEDALLNVLKDDINPYVGLSTYKRVNDYLTDFQHYEDIAAASENPVPDLLKNVNTQLKNVASITGSIPATKDTGWAKALKVASAISNFMLGITPDDDKKTKTYPSIIDAEVAMSGTIKHDTKIDRAEFVIETPGVAGNDNTTEFGTGDKPAYPFYNEALGRFALLTTPTINREAKTTIVQTYTFSNGDVLTTLDDSYRYQLDESTIDYVYNPAIGVNHDKTVILGSYVVEVEDADLQDIFSAAGHVNGLELAYTNININDKHVYKSPFLPLECLAHTTIEAVKDRRFWTQDIDGTTITHEVAPRNLKVYLELMILYEFNELDREGKPNKDIQLITYPIKFNDNHETELQDQISTIQGDLTLNTTNFAQNSTIQAFNSVTIDGILTANNGVNVIIRANEIILEEGTEIGEGITLEVGNPLACGVKIPNFQGDMTNYCNTGGYTADVPRRQEVDPLVLEIDLEVPTLEMKVGLTPNPTSDIAELLIADVNIDETITVQVVNMMGQLILETQTISNGDVMKLDLDLSSYPSGTYGIICNAQNGQSKTLKLVKL